jgi:hypothetical protein
MWHLWMYDRAFKRLSKFGLQEEQDLVQAADLRCACISRDPYGWKGPSSRINKNCFEPSGPSFKAVKLKNNNNNHYTTDDHYFTFCWPCIMLWTRNFQACLYAVNLLGSVSWDVEGVMHIKFCALWHTATTAWDCLQEQIWISVVRSGASLWRCNATQHTLDERFIVVISVGSSETSPLLSWPFPARLLLVLATEATFWRLLIP